VSPSSITIGVVAAPPIPSMRSGTCWYAVRKGSPPRARHTLLCALADLGDGGRQIEAAWRTKELLREVIKLSADQTGVATPGYQLRRAFEAFFTFGATIPEIQTLA
jgi:hypothetical protein